MLHNLRPHLHVYSTLKVILQIFIEHPCTHFMDPYIFTKYNLNSKKTLQVVTFNKNLLKTKFLKPKEYWLNEVLLEVDFFFLDLNFKKLYYLLIAFKISIKHFIITFCRKKNCTTLQNTNLKYSFWLIFCS